MKLKEVLDAYNAGKTIRRGETYFYMCLRKDKKYPEDQVRMNIFEDDLAGEDWEVVKEKVPHYPVIYRNSHGFLTVTISTYHSLETGNQVFSESDYVRLLTEFPELIEMKEVG